MSEEKKFIRYANSLIIQGHGAKVREKLEKMQRHGGAVEDPKKVANLARRVGFCQYSANLLFPLIRDPNTKANDEVKAEYAAALVGLGNYGEALHLYSEISEKIKVKYALEYSDLMFRVWNHNEGAEILERYVPLVEDDYRKIVTQLNLSSAYLGCYNYKKAKQLLDYLEDIALEKNYGMILANVKELKGQILFRSGKLKESKKLFLESEQMLSQSKNWSWLYARKWLCINNIALEPSNNSYIKDLETVRNLAREFKHWETLRELDLYESTILINENLFKKVFYGSPNEKYKKYARDEWPSDFPMDATVHFGTETSSNFIDISKGLFNDQELFRKGDLTHRLFNTFLSDMYRPISSAGLFRECYPNEFYDPDSSNDRVYKIVKKLRETLSLADTNIQIENNKSLGYRLRINSPIKVMYPTGDENIYSTVEHNLKIVCDHFSNRPFTSKELSTFLKVSKRSGIRIINDYLDNDKIVKIGSGPRTKYKIVA